MAERGGFLPIATLGWWIAGAPVAPKLTVTDDGDGTGATFVVSGSATGSTNAISVWIGGVWVVKYSAAGNYTKKILLSVGSYWAFVASTKDGSTSISSIVPFRVTDSDEAEAQYRVVGERWMPNGQKKIFTLEKVDKPLVPR